MKFHLILLLCLGILFASCSNLGSLVDKEQSRSYFQSSDGQITFCQDGNWFELGKVPMEADAKSFKVLSSEIAKDKNTLFFRGYPQKQVDVHSFYIDHDIPKDRNYAYIAGDGKLTKIDGADARSFEYLKNNPAWSKDKYHYYLNYKKVAVDAKTFMLLNQSFSADKDSIYMATETGKFTAILQNTGEANSINDKYLQNRGIIYYLAYHPDPKLLMDSFGTIDTIHVIDKDIIRVNTTIVAYGKKFKYDQVDVNTFQLFPSDDQNYVNDRYSKDGKHVFYDGALIQGADVRTYMPLSFGFGKDDNYAYYQSSLLKGVDSKSFVEMPPQDTTGIVFGDKLGNKFNYWTGKKIN